MASRIKTGTYLFVAAALLIVVSSPVWATSYTLYIITDSNSYTGSVNITVTGHVSPAPGPSTSVLLRFFNPNAVLVTFADVPVNATTGLFSYTFLAGGSSSWVGGTYVVNATWGAYGSAIFRATAFSWSPASVTSSTTTTSTTSSVSTSTSSTSTTSASTSTTSSTSSKTTTSSASTTSSTSSTTTTTSIQTSSSSSSTTSSATTSSTSGNVPEFPYQFVAVIVLSALVVGSYIVVRSRRARIATTGSSV